MKKIAKFAKGEENKKTLRRLASEERAHCEIWESYTGIKMKPQKAKILKYTLIARILGFTFAVKLMERGEEVAQKKYDLLADEIPKAYTSGSRKRNMKLRFFQCSMKKISIMSEVWCLVFRMLLWSWREALPILPLPCRIQSSLRSPA